MNQAKIFWDRENYAQVEKLFRSSAELCGEADVWRLNVAHTLFMQVSNLKCNLNKNIAFICELFSRRANFERRLVFMNRLLSKTTIT